MVIDHMVQEMERTGAGSRVDRFVRSLARSLAGVRPTTGWTLTQVGPDGRTRRLPVAGRGGQREREQASQASQALS